MVFALLVYGKNEQANAAAKIGMTEAGVAKQVRVNVADDLVASVREMGAIMAGRVAPARGWPPAQVDVRALRIRLGLSQPAFTSRFGFSVGAVRDWEQGRRQPDPAARRLLVVIEHDPEAVTRALAAADLVAA